MEINLVCFLSVRPEKLEIERVMKLDLLTTVLPSQLFTSKLYNSSQEGVLFVFHLLCLLYNILLKMCFVCTFF